VWVLARRRCAGWREHLAIVTPDTVVRWHRQGWHLFWRWKSRSQGGRPRLSPEVRELIATISRENRLWGTERIRGELLKLGIVVSNRSIRRYRWRGPARSPSQTWRTFLRNHAHHLWAADLFIVPTLINGPLWAASAPGVRKLGAASRFLARKLLGEDAPAAMTAQILLLRQRASGPAHAAWHPSIAGVGSSGMR